MNFLDIILLIPLLYGLYSGFTQGLIQQLTGLIAVALALLFSIKLSGYAVSFLTENAIVNEGWSGIVGFAITFLGIIIVVKFAGMLVKKTTRTIGLGFVERLLGAACGVLKAFLIMLVLLFFFVKINRFMEIVPDTLFTGSKLYPYYELGFSYLYEFWKPETTTESNITFS